MIKALLIGCGNDHRRKLQLAGRDEYFQDSLLTKLDMNPDCGADIVWDMEDLPLPILDGEFDELHAYDVLEHFGRQGDWRRYFDEFAEYWRILKPGGTLHIIVPCGPDAFADPGHTRFFSPNHFAFLSQKRYEAKQGTQKTDYRWYWKRDFEVIFYTEEGSPAHHICVILRKVG